MVFHLPLLPSAFQAITVPWTMKDNYEWCMAFYFPWCTDDLLNPWQASDFPCVSQSKCITSFDYILLWQSNRQLQTHNSPSPRLTRLLPSVFVKWLALFIKALDESALCSGRDRGGFWTKPWSSQMHINRHLLWRSWFVCRDQLQW